MAEIRVGYMTVTVDIQPEGLNLAMWMSTAEFWASEIQNFPYQYTYIGEWCQWLLHSNTQITSKMIAMIGEQADKICREQEARNQRRKIANR